MASEIRVNQIQNRSGLTTTTFTDTGVTISGILTVSENLNVGGVVTYEDVTNVDAIGIVTARAGINLVGNDLNVGSNIKIGNASGIVTATSFSGSGANLTGITQTTIVNYADNKLVTATGNATTLNAEANLLFDGGTLALNGRYQRGSATVQDGDSIAGGININGTDMDASVIMSVFGNDGDFTRISGSKSRNASVGSHTIVQNNDVLLSVKGFGSDGTNFEEAAQIEMQVDGSPGNNVMPGRIVFKTATTDGVVERLRINSNGQLLVGTTTTPSNSNSKLRVHFDQNTSSGSAIEMSHSTNGADKAGAALGLAIANGGASTNAADLYFQTATGGSLTEKVRITSDGHVSIGYAGDVATSNGNVGRKFGIRSTGNNFIVGETTQSSAHYGIYIEARQTGRSGAARIAQLGLRNDSSGNGVISFQTAPSGADVTERVIIDSAGHLRPVANATYDLGVSGAAWRNLYVNDAHFSNEGGSNSVDGTWGSWTLQEGENDIFMINNRTGKKYAITMKEVE